MYSHRRWCAAVPVLSALSALVVMAHAATIKFDQSQTGDYNLQIHLKNIELYAVFDDSGGSDDEYEDLPDYTDVTNPNENTSSKPPPVQPPAGTPSTTTSAPPSTAAIASTTPQQSTQSPAGQLDPYSTSDKIVQMVEALIASNGNTSDMPTEPPSTVTAVATSPSAASAAPSTAAAPVPLVAQSPAAAATASASASATGGGTANRKCGPGYFRDPMGRCRRIRKPHLPFLQMVHTPGVIKSFQPQQRTAEDDSVAKNENNIRYTANI